MAQFERNSQNNELHCVMYDLKTLRFGSPYPTQQNGPTLIFMPHADPKLRRKYFHFALFDRKCEILVFVYFSTGKNCLESELIVYSDVISISITRVIIGNRHSLK